MWQQQAPDDPRDEPEDSFELFYSISEFLKTQKRPKEAFTSGTSFQQTFSETLHLLSLETKLQDLEQIYKFRDPSDIRVFLGKHEYLINYLIDVYQRLPKYFPNAQLSLEVVAETGSSEEYELQTLIEIPRVDIGNDPDNLFNFYQQWWQDQLDVVEDKLHFVIMYI